MPEETPKTNIVSHALRNISLGVTESIYLLGLVFLAAGISLTFGISSALIVIGALLILTAFSNARERNQQGK
jgi:hypothetical protein